MTTQRTMFDGTDLQAPTLTGDRHGATFNRELDLDRLNAQQLRVYQAMKDGQWRTLSEIASWIFDTSEVHDPEASVSARLRDLRKPEFGGFNVERRRRGTASRGLHEYRIEVSPASAPQSSKEDRKQDDCRAVVGDQ